MITQAKVGGRGLALASATIVGITIVLYVLIIVEQGGHEVGRVAFVVLVFLAALALLIATMSFRDAPARGISGAAAAGLLLSIGFLAIFSVGLPLLLAGVLMVAWLVRTHGERRESGWLPSIGAFILGAVIPWSIAVLS